MTSTPSETPGASSPGITITPNNEGPSVNLATWILLATSSLVVLVKVASKLIRWHSKLSLSSLQADDYFICVALVTAIAQSISISQAVPAGLGQPAANSTQLQKNHFQKAEYASLIFYVVTLGMAKFATFALISLLVQRRQYRTLVHGTMTLTAVWTIAATFGVAFQCSVPKTWAILSEQCFDQIAFWDVIGAFDIMTDLLAILLPIYTLRVLQTTWVKKGTVMLAFSVRIIVIPLTILRLIYLNEAFKSPDRVLYDWKVAVVTQIGMNVSIITACVPFLKPVMAQLQPGWSTGNVQKGIGYNTIMERSGRDTSGYAIGSVTKSHSNTTPPTRLEIMN